MHNSRTSSRWKSGIIHVILSFLLCQIHECVQCSRSIWYLFDCFRYMKYLYPYECDKRGLSNPNELQAAIDSNRREGRRQSFGTSLFTYSPNGTPTMLSSPKLPTPSVLPVGTNGASLTPIQKIKKGEISFTLHSHHMSFITTIIDWLFFFCFFAVLGLHIYIRISWFILFHSNVTHLLDWLLVWHWVGELRVGGWMDCS